MKIKTKGNQEFSVPNDKEGWEFIKSLRKYANGDLHVRLMGRAKNRKDRGGNQYTISAKSADWIAVYLRRPYGEFRRGIGIQRPPLNSRGIE